MTTPFFKLFNLKLWSHRWLFFFSHPTSNSSVNPAFKLLPSKCIQNLATSHYLHCYHPDMSHHHILSGLNWAPCFCSWSLKSILYTHPEHLMKIKSDHVTALLDNLSRFPPPPTQSKGQGHYNLHLPLLSDLISYNSFSFLSRLIHLLDAVKQAKVTLTSVLLHLLCLFLECSFPRYPHCSHHHLLQVFAQITFSVNIAFSI